MREDRSGDIAADVEESLRRTMWKSRTPKDYRLRTPERIDNFSMNSYEVKKAVVLDFRFKRMYPLVTLEFSWDTDHLDAYALADVAAVDDKGRFIEVEVKVSISDLRADLEKKEKHLCLRGSFDLKAPILIPGYREGAGAVPARLYYAVPHDIAQKARKFIADNFPYAGLIEVHDAAHLGVLRPAPKIHDEILDPRTQQAMVRSLSARYAALYSKQPLEA